MCVQAVDCSEKKTKQVSQVFECCNFDTIWAIIVLNLTKPELPQKSMEKVACMFDMSQCSMVHVTSNINKWMMESRQVLIEGPKVKHANLYSCNI